MDEPQDPEDRKLLVLARSSRTRSGSAQGAAVRDLDGRTYAAAAVDLGRLRLSALALATAMAASSGARGLEAAAVVGDDDAVAPDDLAVVTALAGAGVPVWAGAADGRPTARVTT